jgi:hypothetical protein
VVPGEQQISVDAEDLQGRRARASRRVIVDLNGPEIAVTRPAAGGPGEVVVAITDDRELAAVEVDGRALILTPGQTSVSSRIVLGKRAGVAVTAMDRAGNRTVLASTAVSREQAAAAAATDWLLAGRAGASSLRHERAEPVLLAQAAPPADAGPGASAAGGAAPPDTLPPVLRLSPRVEGRIVVTTDVFVLDLQIEDSGGVAAVTFAVDGRQETREFQPADADVRRLTRSVQLSPGPNEIVITARDRAGNPASLKLLVERRQDRAWREDLRVTSQLMPPTSPATPTAAPTVDIYPLMIGAFTQQPARLNLVERDPAVMQRLIAEHRLSQSPLADKTLAIRTGKLKTADWCLVSRVTVWPGQDNFDLLLEVVDVATTEILLTTDIHFASADREHLRFQLRGLVAKLEQQLPRLTAPVATRTGKTLVLPVGSEQQVLRGMYVLFIPADADPADYPEPVTWRGGTWVQGRVTVVRKGSCRVRVEPAEAIGLLKAKDTAILR